MKVLNESTVVKYLFVILIVLTTSLLSSCTDATETINNGVEASEFLTNEDELNASVGDAYGPLAGSNGPGFGGHGGLTVLNEITSDEAVITSWADGGWDDSGVWIRLHRHTFTNNDAAIQQGWNDLFAGVSNTNRIIFQFETILEEGGNEELINPFISEMKALRAYYYYLLLDHYGNVPIVTGFADVPEDPSQPSSNFEEGRQAVFNFVESELLESLDNVTADVSATDGRINKWAIHAILVRLYLNAEVYTGTPRWEDAIFHADQVINSGNFSLVNNYADNFAIDNTGSPELIFVIPYDEVFNPGFTYTHMTQHIAGGQQAFDLGTQPWGGYSTVTEFYESYIDPEQNPGPQGTVIGLGPLGEETTGTLDERLSNIMVGPLLDQQGNQVEDPAVTELDPDGPPITYTPFQLDLVNDLRQSGGRISKYEIEVGQSSGNMNNDLVLLRYGEVLLNKAEALWRLDSGSTESLMLVNTIRSRSGVDSFNSLNADRILAERGRELFFEHVRRQDLIRFSGDEGATAFNDSWRFKDVTPETRNVFPIPQDQLEANPNLVQNPGY
jgi:hypothetical protein